MSLAKYCCMPQQFRFFFLIACAFTSFVLVYFWIEGYSVDNVIVRLTGTSGYTNMVNAWTRQEKLDYTHSSHGIDGNVSLPVSAEAVTRSVIGSKVDAEASIGQHGTDHISGRLNGSPKPDYTQSISKTDTLSKVYTSNDEEFSDVVKLQSVMIKLIGSNMTKSGKASKSSTNKELGISYRSLLNTLVRRVPYLVPISQGVLKLMDTNSPGSETEDTKGGANKLLKEESSKLATEDIIRYGIGLEAYTTEQGDEGWIENGVVYRPHHPKPSKRKYPSPYIPEIEAYVPYDHERFFEGKLHPPVNQNDRKIILWWIPTRYFPPTSGLSPLRACPDLPCVVTTNRQYTEQSSAMIVAGQIIAEQPPDRKPHQVLIFHNHEAEANWRHHHVLSNPTSRWISAFNWTMTYHPQSDFYVPYGITRRRRIPSFRNYTAIMEDKTKMVAWIVSHCSTQSKRLEYVRKLQKYIPVDIYGQCGTFRCPRANDDECFQVVNRTYKFYLSFENALCSDYMTEKVFRYFAANTITVARASNEFYAHAPSEIFLNTADFSSPKALADRMWYLANHDEAYIEMLREKDKYMILYEDYPIRLKDGQIKFMAYRYEAPAFCELCHRLWNMDKYGNSWVPDIRKWLMEQQCQKPQDL